MRCHLFLLLAAWGCAPAGGGAVDAGLRDPADGYQPPPIDDARSLTWTQPALLDDPEVAGLPRVVGTMCPGSNAGVLWEHWLRTFTTTDASQRPAFGALLEDFAATHGADPATWDLGAFPVKVTALVHRPDLADGASHCGEFRVAMASTHPVYAPIHFLWLFRLPGTDCKTLARRLAALSSLEEPAFLAEARALVTESLVPERFLSAESVEFTQQPWEWRMWNTDEGSAPGRTCTLTNPPLFQQTDSLKVGVGGAQREAFLRWVAQNAEALDARRALIPEAFRGPFQWVNQGYPWVKLDLSGVAPAVLEAHPDLRRNMEIVGCGACHAVDAPFLHVDHERAFSPFYVKELAARARFLARLTVGEWALPPFGPLQEDPVLPR